MRSLKSYFNSSSRLITRDFYQIIRQRRSNSATSIISTKSIKELRRHSSGTKSEQVRQNLDNDISENKQPNIVPNIDLNLPVNRRRQSIEGSIIMAEQKNILSANISIGANGPNSTTDHEYDSGKVKLRRDTLQYYPIQSCNVPGMPTKIIYLFLFQELVL